MVWVDGHEIKDFRCLTFKSNDNIQHVFIGGRLDECKDQPISLVVPVPCSAPMADKYVVADGKHAHLILEICKESFPDVVRESLLVGDSSISSMAKKFQVDEFQKRSTLLMAPLQLISIGGSNPLGDDRHSDCNCFMHFHLFPQTTSYFAFSYSFQSDESSLHVPVSTLRCSNQAHHLEPVTCSMDHRIFTFGAKRNSGLPNGAGKTCQEMLEDMKKRHASGTCTVILSPMFAQQEIFKHLGDIQVVGDSLRYRRIIGPYNTSEDIIMQVDDEIESI